MGTKQIIGLSLDGPLLRMAILEEGKDSLRLAALQTVEFEHPIMAQAFQEKVSSEVRTPAFVEEQEGTGDDSESSNGSYGTEDEIPDDLFSLTDAYEHEDQGDENDIEKVIELFNSLRMKKMEIGLGLPLGSTIFHPVEEKNYSSTKKKEIKEIVENRIRAVYEPSDSEVHYAYEIQENGRMLLVSREGDIPILQSLETAGELSNTKLTYREIMPDETAVIGLIRSNYELESGQVTAIIQTGFDSSRIIILEEHHIFAVLPLIHRGHRADDAVQTCLSKLILELDQGNIPELHQIIAINSTLGDNHYTFVLEHLPGVHIESFQFNEALMEIDPEFEENLHQFIPAIGSAWIITKKAQGDLPVLSLLPRYIKDRQKVFKLKWHGILLIFLIALTPIGFNKMYQDKMAEYDGIARQTINTWQQVEVAKPFVGEVEELAQSISAIHSDLELLDTLSHGSLRWSANLVFISNVFDEVNSCWIDKMVTLSDRIVIEGYARYRNRVPRLAAKFREVEIKEVTEVTLRDVQVYKFLMHVTKVVDDPAVYNPAGESNS